MKLTVLCDNNTIIDSYYEAEPALSFYLEDDGKKILFDTGYSDVFKRNANKMNIDLSDIDVLCLSHGHNDHTGGLVYLDELNKNVDVFCHPLVDEKKDYFGIDVSMPYSFDDLNPKLNVIRSEKPVKISEHLIFLGTIERTIQPLKYLDKDPLWDDTALVYQNDKGIFIITGCSHSGICNIVQYSKKVTGCQHVLGIIGGFHMLKDPLLNKEVCSYLKKEDIEVCYPCHCTDLKAKIALSRVVNVEEIGVSTVIEVQD